VGESGKGNGKVRVGDNVLPVNLLPYLAEAYPWPNIENTIWGKVVGFPQIWAVVSPCTKSAPITH